MTATVTGSGWGALAAFMVGQARKLDKALDYGAETRLVIGSGPGTAGTLFGRLEADLDAGLEAGVVVLALIMATGSAWGLSRRLAEYR